MKPEVYTTFINSASITRGITYAKLTHTVARGRYTTEPYLFPAPGEGQPSLVLLLVSVSASGLGITGLGITNPPLRL
jgi:hypothetical protein